MTQELQGLNPDKAAASHMAHNVTLKKPINLKKLFPDDLALYEYFGSLTQFSDCNEIVRWAVLKTTVKISAEQVKFEPEKLNII
jgi:carbonic anhydrase